MTETTLNNYAISEPKPVMEKVKEKREWTRTTFNFHDGKEWIYKKIEQCKEYDREIQTGYYCALPSCRNELIFKWKDKHYRDPEPFKFHKTLVKVLDKRDDDWRTGRKTHTYLAFCCKCAKARHGDNGKVVKHKITKKLMEVEIDKCECETFIEDKKKEANQAIIYHNSVIADCNELMSELKPLVAKYSKGIIEVDNGYKKSEIDKNFKARRLNDFIKQLESRRSDDINARIKEEDYLKLYNEWETKRNQQLKDYEKN